MLVIYGTKKKLKVDKDLGMTTCSNCGHSVKASLAHEGGYHHIYYIPIFPYLNGAKIIACPNCGIMKVLTKDEYNTYKNN